MNPNSQDINDKKILELLDRDSNDLTRPGKNRLCRKLFFGD